MTRWYLISGLYTVTYTELLSLLKVSYTNLLCNQEPVRFTQIDMYLCTVPGN